MTSKKDLNKWIEMLSCLSKVENISSERKLGVISNLFEYAEYLTEVKKGKVNPSIEFLSKSQEMVNNVLSKDHLEDDVKILLRNVQKENNLALNLAFRKSTAIKDLEGKEVKFAKLLQEIKDEQDRKKEEELRKIKLFQKSGSAVKYKEELSRNLDSLLDEAVDLIVKRHPIEKELSQIDRR